MQKSQAKLVHYNRSVHVIFQFARFIGLAIGFGFSMPITALAEEAVLCPVSASVLLHSCKDAASVRLRVLPDEPSEGSEHLLTVAGTYSSGDRFGIEGLVIQAGKIVSKRYQNWDGVLVVDTDGTPNLFHATDVAIGADKFDLKDKTSRADFITKAQDTGVTVIQSHLLIVNGTLDLKDVENAPEFKRRLLVTFEDGSFGVWETAQSETLFAAAHQVQSELMPKMALNLDMGAYDYCKRGPKGAQSDCGRLIVSTDKLTNLLEFTKR